MAVTRDYNKPLQEEEPYLVQNKNLGQSDTSRLTTSTDWYGNPITEPDRSNPTRNRYESPLQTIMSFEYAIQKEESDLLTTRPNTALTNLRYSYQAQPVGSRRQSSYSQYNQPPPQQRQDSTAAPSRQDYIPSRQDYIPSRQEYIPSRQDSQPSTSAPREYRQPPATTDSPAETSRPGSFYNQYPNIDFSHGEYSPPSTPTTRFNYPQQPPQPQREFSGQYNYGMPSPEPDGDGYTRPPVPAKPIHSFVTRPATPPSEVSEGKNKKKKEKSKMFKRLSGFGKSKT